MLGRGGMGEVYLAHDTRLGRNVAVKLLRPDLTSNPEAVRRFEQEARAASSLNHPNIVTIYEIGELEDRRFLAMEFVDGRSLDAMLGGPVSISSVAQIGAQLAQALAVAHAAGIVHRDIKPENIMVREDGYVKLLDFGVARLLSAPAGAERTPDDVGHQSRRHSRHATLHVARTGARRDGDELERCVFAGRRPVRARHRHAPVRGGVDARNASRHHFSRDAEARSQGCPGHPRSSSDSCAACSRRQQTARPSADEVEAELTKLAGVLSERIRLGPFDGGDQERHHNLPPQRTPVIGRTAELATVQGMLLDPDIRLLTLTGPGGTGKTRLAVQVAADLADLFDGGVSFVNLAPIADPWLVASAVALAVGVRESGDRPLVRAIADHLRNRGPTLLLMDNFEQVSDAAALVRELLDACPALKVLVTSRLVLHIYGEQEFPVPPLPLPALDAVSAPATLMECASIALFVQRAAAGRPDFTLTAKNAEAVVDICRRLDGLPLAIELAAARVKILPPAELLARIERRLELLTGGARDLPERQQTLRGAIKWSYDLLTPPEQTLFRRLSVFAGGCTLEGVEAVCNTCEDLGVDVLDGVASLVDNSLLVQRVSDDAEPRFIMLETFREYGRERLLDSGETAATGRAHAAYMLVLAEEGTLEMNPSERDAWLRCCDAEHDNFRGAIHYLITTGNAEWALRLGGALFRFWEQRDHLTEGRETLARVLAMPGAEAPTRARARALYGATVLADIQGELSTAERLSHEACAIYRQFDDTGGIAATMTAMAWQAQRQGRHAEATRLFRETVSLWQQLGEADGGGHGAEQHGERRESRGELRPRAKPPRRRSPRHSTRGETCVASRRPSTVWETSRPRRETTTRPVGTIIKASSGTARSTIDGELRGCSRIWPASIFRPSDYAAANASLKEALHAFRALGHQRGVARQLESLSWCAGCQSRDEDAIVLASAAAAIRQKIGTPAKQIEREKIDRTLTAARLRISADAYASAWREGRTATLDRVLEITTAPRP